MNKLVSKLAFLVIALLFSVGVFSQHHKNEFYVSGSVGFSKFMYKLNTGNNTFGVGGGLGFGYKRFFTEHIGLSLGLQGAMYNGSFRTSKLTYHEDAYDHIFKNVAYTAVSSAYREKHRSLALNIPLMLHLQTGGKHRIYTALGAKLSFPLSLTGKQSTIDKIVASGDAPFYNVDFTNVPIMGYGTFKKDQESKLRAKDMELKTKLNVLLSAELGVKWQLGSRTFLYTALFADYGITSMTNITNPEYNKDFLPFYGMSALNDNNENAGVVLSSVLNSRYDYNDNKEDLKFIPDDVIRPFIVGVKLALAFGPKDKTKQSPKEDLVLLPLLPIEELPDSLVEPTLEPKPLIAEVPEILPIPIVIKDEYISGITEEEKLLRPDEDVALVVDNYVINGKELSNYWKRTIDDVILPLKDKGDYHFILEGHTCTYGSNAINDRLSLDRARVVKAYMVSIGFDPEKIEIIGRGKHIPVVPNTSEVNRKKNRRVVFFINKTKQDHDAAWSRALAAPATQAERAVAKDTHAGRPAIQDERLARLTDAERALRPECDIALTIDNYLINGKELSSYWKNTIDEVILPLKDSENCNFSLEGHTCSYGSDAINDKLSLDRARLVKEYLVSKGFSPDRIQIEGKGKHNPIVPNTSESNRRKNRRVVFIVKDNLGAYTSSQSSEDKKTLTQSASVARPTIQDERLANITEAERALRPECDLALTIDNYVINAKGLSDYWKKSIDEKILPLKDVINCNFTLEGHTCSYGSDEINDKLSLDRARLVRDYLVSKGFSADRIKIEGKGKNKPVVPNTSESNRKKNRRVVFILSPKN